LSQHPSARLTPLGRRPATRVRYERGGEGRDPLLLRRPLQLGQAAQRLRGLSPMSRVNNVMARNI